MSHYHPPIKEMNFLMSEVFDLTTEWSAMPVYADTNLDLANAILEEGGKLFTSTWEPLNRSGDEEGCHLESEQVITPAGFREAWSTMSEGGWLSLTGEPEHGGQGVPKALSVLFEEMQYATNASLALYSVLTVGAALTLNQHANSTIKSLYLPMLYDGRCAGTMCLTEPQAGSDLGVLTTRAEPVDAQEYRLNGSKIFITGGDHDLTENILHLVLARLPDAPVGSKGISLFLVPKFCVDANGEPIERNGVSCGSIEAKMGIKGSATAVLNFDDAKGFLVGEPNQGLKYMFTMMNYERLSIGVQGIGQAEWSMQQAQHYAFERTQGRSINPGFQSGNFSDPIISHADVRRMLLTQSAWIEPGRALAVYLGTQLDRSRHHPDAEVRSAAEVRAALLTPVAKAFFSDRGLECTVLGQQVFGGHGYIREWGLEQAVRDVRIAQIYEGTNGIQAMDFMVRKVLRDDGENLIRFFDEIRRDIDQLPDELAVCGLDLNTVMDRVCSLVRKWATLPSHSDVPGMQAYNLLELTALISYGWLWLKMAKCDPESELQKSQKATFFFNWLWPISHTLLKRAECPSGTFHFPVPVN